MSGRALRKVRELPIELWCGGGGGGGGRCGMLPGSERCSGGGIIGWVHASCWFGFVMIYDGSGDFLAMGGVVHVLGSGSDYQRPKAG